MEFVLKCYPAHFLNVVKATMNMFSILTGCMCPEGYARYEDECIIPEICPCAYNNIRYENGETIHRDCMDWWENKIFNSSLYWIF